ncbi:MAG TPA: YlxR family protein [Pseudonocardia sp.]|nr:YlxR family protein [Pseudonocardia sp.]
MSTAALHSEAALDSGSAPARPIPAAAFVPAAGPIRTCVGCRVRSAADGLLRVVVVDGVLTPDPRRRFPGRGAWLHPAPECLDRAERRSAFPRALRVPGPLDVAAVRLHIASGTVSSSAVGIRETPASVTSGSKVDPS